MATPELRTESRQTNDETPAQGRRTGQFGLRMAVLAGVIATGSATTGLTSPVNTMIASGDTTCCSNGNASVVKTV